MNRYQILGGWSNRYSVEFDGVSAYLTIDAPTATALDNNIRTAMTFSLWFRIIANPAPGGIVYLYGHPGAFIVYLRFNSPTWTLYAVRYGGGNVTSSVAGLALSDGAFHHFAFGATRAGATGLYVDGVKRDTDAVPDAALASVNVAAFLGSSGVSSFFNNAYLDEFSVWSAQLSDGGVAVGQAAGGQIAELYHGGAPANLTAHSAAGNLVSWLRMGDGDTYPTITDGVGGYNWTMTNMTADDIVEVTP